MAAKQDFPAETVATLLLLDVRRLQQLAAEGYVPRGAERGTYPLVGAVQGYIKFLRERGKSTGRGTEHARLARAQAVKVEMENYRRAGQYVVHDQALELFTETAAELNSGLEAVASRLCNELANINDAGEIRQRLQAEHRSIRARLASRIQEFADSCEVRADDLENVPAAGDEDAGGMGEAEPEAAAGLAEAG
jgi:phage terminase Nu1 subunit (DNA packaging protein)